MFLYGKQLVEVYFDLLKFYCLLCPLIFIFSCLLIGNVMHHVKVLKVSFVAYMCDFFIENKF